MRHFLMALQFLTRYPTRILSRGIPEAGDLGASTGYFPLVGFLAGLELLLIRTVTLMDPVGMHQPLWTLLILVHWIWLCDSLHLDGLGDTLDALGSGSAGRGMLDVLHDPRLGTFGVLGIVLSVLAKWCWLRYLPMHFIWFIPLPLVSSRLLLSLGCQIRPYAGEPGSLSSAFIEHSTHADAHRAFALAFSSFFLLAAPCIYWGATTLLDAGIALAACLFGVVCGWLFLRTPLRRLGGVNGDLLGYAQQIAELSAAFALFFGLVRA